MLAKSGCNWREHHDVVIYDLLLDVYQSNHVCGSLLGAKLEVGGLRNEEDRLYFILGHPVLMLIPLQEDAMLRSCCRARSLCNVREKMSRSSWCAQPFEEKIWLSLVTSSNRSSKWSDTSSWVLDSSDSIVHPLSCWTGWCLLKSSPFSSYCMPIRDPSQRGLLPCFMVFRHIRHTTTYQQHARSITIVYCNEWKRLNDSSRLTIWDACITWRQIWGGLRRGTIGNSSPLSPPGPYPFAGRRPVHLWRGKHEAGHDEPNPNRLPIQIPL